MKNAKRIIRAIIVTVGMATGILLGTEAAAACQGLLNVSMDDIRDNKTDLCQYQGKVVLAVNTASKCGFTPQFEALEKLQKRYKSRGLVVLGFPSNDFRQELGNNKSVAEFCELNYGVTFPMFAMSGVSGRDANPLFQRLAERSGKRPQWNFHKYLVDRKGEQVLSFDSETSPDDPKLVAGIERLLAARPN